MLLRGFALLLAAATLPVLLTGCPPAQQGGTKTGSGGQTASGPGLKVQLVLSDLGLADGQFARKAHELLEAEAGAGRIEYSSVGTVPEQIQEERAGDDVGLPPGSFGIESNRVTELPGEMTQAAAVALLDSAEDCDLLVLTAASLVQPALDSISSGAFKAGAILLLDNDGYAAPASPAVPVYAVSYDLEPVGFLAGVAAGASSNTGMFMVVGVDTDPDADTWLRSTGAGAKFRTNGARVVTGTAKAGEDGIVAPDEFLQAFTQLQAAAGPGFRCNHYLIAAGRATPSIMYALSKKPTDGYVIGGWADFTSVRPARFVCCAIKKPDMALKHILGQIQSVDDLAGLAQADAAAAEAPAEDETSAAGGEDGAPAAEPSLLISVGLDEDAVGISDFEQYGRFNPDGDDIREAIMPVLAEIKSGEFDYKAAIEQFNSQN